ncbi:type I polyketide synthase [Cryptosporangium sp. NPDC051539]|uniref:type I polyketide synthase n=1 Tax=Cryptosporangium sp. NPDC051539 TaxID=3363962 RepID=UPI0037922369
MATAEPIAIVGMAGRFPAANDLEEFRANLFAGRECLTELSREQLLESGEDPDDIDDPDYVRRRPILADVDGFDARFFDLSPRDAEVRDPQHRLFLETAHSALEHAAYDSQTYAGRIGVYTGSNMNSYRIDFVEKRPDLYRSAGRMAIDLGNSPDYLATFVAYKLGLRGPALTVLTACSTSLVAVHEACNALRVGDCDLAIAGGADVEFPVDRGYFHVSGGTLSKDGVSRPFDDEASGTNFGSGAGAVVLKPLATALADRDTVYAVVRGTAINNDGDRKAGFTAPSVAGQSECIQRALRVAGVDPATIGYVEAHGTATPIGDPIELAGLVDAFRAVGGPELPDRYCAIGSVKSNVGHLGQASGVTGLIKTVLALRAGRIPATLNVNRLNRQVDWEDTPFVVATRSMPWPAGPDGPRRAGVSSFGIGGTNAHLVLEEAPSGPPPPPGEPAVEAVLWSAVDAPAADRLAQRLTGYFARLDEADFPDAAHSLRTGRTVKRTRAALVAAGPAEATTLLRSRRGLIRPDGTARRLAFVFPGVEPRHLPAMRDLYVHEALFRQGCDAAFDVLEPLLDVDLRPALAAGDPAALARPLTALPLLYTAQYVLAQSLIHWGAHPDVVFGHGLGELVAGAVAGGLDFESGLCAVAERARLVETSPRRSALTVGAGAGQVIDLLPAAVSVAAVNGARQVELVGPDDEIVEVARRLAAHHVPARAPRAAHGLPDPELGPLVPLWRDRLADLAWRRPELSLVSTVPGAGPAAGDAVSPDFWAAQLITPVDFDAAAAAVLSAGPTTVVEIGGGTLEPLLRARPDLRASRSRVLPAAGGERTGEALQRLLSQLWVDGRTIGYWRRRAEQGEYRRIAAPGYPYDRQRFWADPR